MPQPTSGPANRAASLLHGRPLALRRDMMGTSFAALSAALAADQGEQRGLVRRIARQLGIGRTTRPSAGRLALGAGDCRSYGTFSDGVAIINVEGVLLDRAIVYFDWFTDEPYVCVDGYDRIWSAIEEAIADAQVTAILLRIASPGGLVTGCFELCAKIAAARSKPILAYLADYAFSAGYAVACSTQGVIAAESGSTGSIGCLAVHESYAGFLEAQGVVDTFIQSHALKSAGDPAKLLEPEAEAMIQAQVDAAATLFTAHVAAQRGLDAAAIDAMQAGWFTAEAALGNGLIDAIASFDETLAAFAADPAALLARLDPELSPEPEPTDDAQPGSPSSPPTENETMKMKPAQTAKKPGAAATAQVDQTDPDKKDPVEGESDGPEEGEDEEEGEADKTAESDKKDEAAKIAASPLAAKHPQIAIAAIGSKMTLKQFEAAAKAAGPGGKSGQLAQRMQGEQPLGPDGKKPGGQTASIDANAIYAGRRKTVDAARRRHAA
jgi:signal peptide peptidase SppA